MRLVFTLFLGILYAGVYAQTGCPDCIISLPDTLPDDALYLDSLANGQAGSPYNETLSFRLPMTTTPIAESGEDIPSGIGLSRFEIEQVLGVPPGLNWELSNDVFMVSDGDTDGCVRICGTPIIAGSYLVEVQLRAFAGPISSPASVFVPLTIEQQVVNNDGFSIINASACGEVTAEFVNNNPSNGQDGFSYIWNFGQGTSSFEENPEPVTYSEAGTYLVEYEAVIDTSAFTLLGVTVLGAGCDDAFGGRPDLYIRIFDPLGNQIFESSVVDNADFPTSFSTFIDIAEGTYSVQVIDEDSGLGGGDDDCGSIDFNQNTDESVQINGSLSLTLDIFHPIDVIQATDTVIVLPQPDDPIIDPSGMIDLCAGEVLELLTINYDSNLVWTSNGDLLEESDSLLVVVDSGAYVASFQNAVGCVAISDTVFVDLLPAVSATPLIRTEGNLVATQDGADVPPGTEFMWLLDGQPFNEDQLFFCPTINGTYTLLVTDPNTGCSFANDIVVADANEVVCDTPVEELLPSDGWLVYPNPSFLGASLRVPENVSGSWDLELIDQLGRSVWQLRYAGLNNYQDLELNWTGLPGGRYHLIARSETGVVILPISRR
ncbi:MAG: PKD domain-containing protein [Bacteroidota bacterium]